MGVVSARSGHLAALLSALLVTSLWATSFLLVKAALPFVPPMTLVGLRYGVAFLLLLGYALLFDRRRPSRLPWGALILIGVLQFGLAQVLQYVALGLLPVATIALTFSLLPALQALVDAFWLKEPPSRSQLTGAAVTLGGIALYLPWRGAVAWGGLVLMAASLVASTIALTLSRAIARERRTTTLVLTVTSMGAGALAVLPLGLAFEASPQLSPSVLLSLLWLSLANTAVAFSLWNHALRVLTAFEANVIGNSTIFQVGILGWVVLGEALTGRQIAGMIVAAAGVLLTQWQALRSSQERVPVSRSPGESPGPPA
ncbi:MAG TPA: EamA family transporter [bacterium]|jgi:probable blue pigment (indigoidine) exporter|nr:EamA family transporter [bacterium]